MGRGAGFAPGVAQGEGRTFLSARAGAAVAARSLSVSLPDTDFLSLPFSPPSTKVSILWAVVRLPPCQGVLAWGAVKREVFRERREETWGEAGERKRERMKTQEKQRGKKKGKQWS